MKWYYADSDKQVGPVNDETFHTLVKEGKITPDTLVWKAGMDDWEEYGALIGDRAAGSREEGGQAHCSECGRVFPQNDMIRYGESWVCAACKPVFIQKLKEGITVSGLMAYGGFWIRFGAKIIDGLIVAALNMMVNIPIGIYSAVSASKGDSGSGAMVLMIIGYIINFGLGIAYVTFFLGKYAATPGKMACRLKVVTPDGGRITYMRALGRYFGELVSWLLLGIGYIIAAFDDEKRTLHDRMCSTRVVRTGN